MTSHPNFFVPFKLGYILDQITWSILLLSIHWKYLLCLEYPTNFHVHLPKFHPGSNSISHTTSSTRLNHHPYPQSYFIFTSLAYNSIWYDTHHIVTQILASYAIVRYINYQSISSLKGTKIETYLSVYLSRHLV